MFVQSEKFILAHGGKLGDVSIYGQESNPTMGATHFLTRTIGRVSTEMSLHVLAYNMKRVIKLLGSEAVMKAMRA
jgi:hypothetical protein